MCRAACVLCPDRPSESDSAFNKQALRHSAVLAPATRAALVVAVQPLKAKLPRGDPGWQANEFVIAIERPLNALSFVGTVTGHVMRARRPGAQRFMHLPAEQPV